MENIPKIADICDRWLEKLDNDFAFGENRTKFDPLNLSVKLFNGIMMSLEVIKFNKKYEEIAFNNFLLVS